MQVDTSILGQRAYVPALAPAPAAVPAEPGEQSQAGALTAESDSRPGVTVTLSAEGLKRSQQTAAKNADIEESDLPDEVKQLLKMIRELKTQLDEKMAELQAQMAQGDMDDDEQQAAVRALQLEVGTLNSALSTANAQLVKVMRDQNLSSEQSSTAASLMAR